MRSSAKKQSLGQKSKLLAQKKLRSQGSSSQNSRPKRTPDQPTLYRQTYKLHTHHPLPSAMPSFSKLAGAVGAAAILGTAVAPAPCFTCASSHPDYI
jgi:hypothetical protein